MYFKSKLSDLGFPRLVNGRPWPMANSTHISSIKPVRVAEAAGEARRVKALTPAVPHK